MPCGSAVQTKGSACRLCPVMKRWIAACRSTKLTKLPRRSPRRLNFETNCSEASPAEKAVAALVVVACLVVLLRLGHHVPAWLADLGVRRCAYARTIAVALALLPAIKLHRRCESDRAPPPMPWKRRPRSPRPPG